jgi:hypothetical protein
MDLVTQFRIRYLRRLETYFIHTYINCSRTLTPIPSVKTGVDAVFWAGLGCPTFFDHHEEKQVYFYEPG